MKVPTFDNLSYFRGFGLEARDRIINETKATLDKYRKKIREVKTFDEFYSLSQKIETCIKNLATHMDNEMWYNFVADLQLDLNGPAAQPIAPSEIQELHFTYWEWSDIVPTENQMYNLKGSDGNIRVCIYRNGIYWDVINECRVYPAGFIIAPFPITYTNKS